MSFKNKLIGSDELNRVFQEFAGEYFTHNYGKTKANKHFNIFYVFYICKSR